MGQNCTKISLEKEYCCIPTLDNDRIYVSAIAKFESWFMI